MSNYPNMSYCMCENTLSAMNQILEAMQEEGPMFLQEMNRDERRAFEQLFHAAEAFLTLSEELEAEYEEELAEGNLHEEDA
jgi:benzoyl-CoA reductase/2-hydroxyglutaryl-CoA dehydratase subunit BcrC/BadD/HgdB